MDSAPFGCSTPFGITDWFPRPADRNAPERGAPVWGIIIACRGRDGQSCRATDPETRRRLISMMDPQPGEIGHRASRDSGLRLYCRLPTAYYTMNVLILGNGDEEL